MAYLPLNNFKYDSGPHRIQSGPDHEGYIVVTSGVYSTGADTGVIVAGTPLSGIIGDNQHWAYDTSWRYSPLKVTIEEDRVLYDASGTLNYYDGARPSTVVTAAGVKVSSAIESNTVYVNSKYQLNSYYGGSAPDNQAYDPFNTPEYNTPAEGITGGGVTHRLYEGPLLRNVLGSQGTSDSSEWEYSKPVYCKTYTESIRAGEPGALSTPVRSIYRGPSCSYSSNYGATLYGALTNFPFDDTLTGCDYPVGCPTISSGKTQILAGDTLYPVVYCNYTKIEWFRDDGVSLGIGDEYTTTEADIGYKIYYTVTYPNGSIDTSSVNCYGVVLEDSLRKWFRLASGLAPQEVGIYRSVIDANGDMYITTLATSNQYPRVFKVSNERQIIWSTYILLDPSKPYTGAYPFATLYHLLDTGRNTIDFLAYQLNSPNPGVCFQRYILNKTDGSVISSAATNYLTSGNFNPSSVVVDADNNYYVAGVLGTAPSSSTGRILKFTRDLTLVWALTTSGPYLFGLNYCNVFNDYDGGVSLSMNSDGLVGFWYGGSYVMSPSYFEIDTNGNLLKAFRTKVFVRPTSFNPYYFIQPQSVYKDNDGNVYSVLRADGLQADTWNVLTKDDPNDNLLWAYTISSTWADRFPGQFVGMYPGGDRMIIRDSKLVFVGSAIVGGSQRPIVLIVFDPDTGIMLSAHLITGAPAGGEYSTVQALPEDNKFLIQTNSNVRMRLDVNDIPSGTYICTDAPPDGQNYFINPIPPIQSGVAITKFEACSPSARGGLAKIDLSSYFTPATPVILTSGVTSRVFQNFAGQDL